MSNAPVESKVVASTVTSAIVLVVLYVLGKWNFVQDMPEQIKGALGVVILAGLTFAAGYIARHTPRGLVRDDPEDTGHARLAVLAAVAALGLVLAGALVTPAAAEGLKPSSLRCSRTC